MPKRVPLSRLPRPGPSPVAEAVVDPDGPPRALVPAEPVRRALDVADAKWMVAERKKFDEFVAAQLVADKDYGVVPGTGGKPTLFKPGAEKIGRFYLCRPEYEVQERERAPNGHSFYRTCCRWVHVPTATVLAEGEGCCSSRESKYRYRLTGEWLATEPEGNNGEWVKKKTKYGNYAWARRAENPDPADVENTVLKMAAKRAAVAAALHLGCASERFSQDLEDHAEAAETAPPAAAGEHAADAVAYAVGVKAPAAADATVPAPVPAAAPEQAKPQAAGPTSPGQAKLLRAEWGAFVKRAGRKFPDKRSDELYHMTLSAVSGGRARHAADLAPAELDKLLGLLRSDQITLPET